MRPRAPNIFTYSSKVLRFALCDPQGLPVFVGSTVRRCLGQYVMMRGGIVLGDESERQYWELMLRCKWSIRNATITCKTDNPIEELPEREKDKAKARAAKGRQVPEGRQEAEPISAREPQSRKQKIAAARGEKTETTRPQTSRRKTRTA